MPTSTPATDDPVALGWRLDCTHFDTRYSRPFPSLHQDYSWGKQRLSTFRRLPEGTLIGWRIGGVDQVEDEEWAFEHPYDGSPPPVPPVPFLRAIDRTDAGIDAITAMYVESERCAGNSYKELTEARVLLEGAVTPPQVWAVTDQIKDVLREVDNRTQVVREQQECIPDLPWERTLVDGPRYQAIIAAGCASMERGRLDRELVVKLHMALGTALWT